MIHNVKHFNINSTNYINLVKIQQTGKNFGKILYVERIFYYAKKKFLVFFMLYKMNQKRWNFVTGINVWKEMCLVKWIFQEINHHEPDCLCAIECI